MKFKVKEFNYTMEKAIEDAQNYYKKNGNRKIIDKEFKHCRLAEVIAYADKYNVKYSDVKIIACAKSIDWEDCEESYFEISFDAEMIGEELENAIKEMAKKLYKDSKEYYKTKVLNSLNKQLQNQFNYSVTKEI